MMQNNNRPAVRKIAFRSIRQNRMRNLFVILAIILTTFMFTSVFSIGFSVVKNLNIMLVRQSGTTASIFLEHPTETQISQVKTCQHLKAAGLQIAVGTSVADDNSSTFSMVYYDETEFEKHYRPAITDIHGSYPVGEKEIMLSRNGLMAMEIQNPVIGQEISLSLDGNTKTFTLSGWFTDFKYGTTGFPCLVSKAYAQSLGRTAEQDGILAISSTFLGNQKLSEELKNISLESGQEWYGIEDPNDEQLSTIIVAAVSVGLICLLILASGYLLIYNVMYISVSRDIRFYGMLKTIGTSPKQIRKIVRIQATVLGVVGIPLGILMGILTSFVAVPYALRVFVVGADNDTMPMDITYSPLIYLFTILFALLTIAVSCRKPANLASRISPIEAMKYEDKGSSKKQKVYPSRHGGKPRRLVFRNVFRQKKRAILVFASLFMGTVAFLATHAFLSSMKLENYVDYYLPNDYTVYISSDETDENHVQQAEQLADDMAQIQGITDVQVNYEDKAYLDFDKVLYQPFLEEEMQNLGDYYMEHPSEYTAPIIAVDRMMLEKYNQRARQKVDLDRFERGEVCVIGNVRTEEQAVQMQGKTIKMHNADGSKSLSLKVGSCMTYDGDYGINVGYYWQNPGAPSCILVSKTAMDRLTDTPSICNILADCDPKAEYYVTEQIKLLTKSCPVVLQTEVKSEMISGFETSMKGMHLLTGGISIILILIGILNFVNVMMTSVFTRRRELAVMESVGMTKKQVRRMLVGEGLCYAVITVLLIGTLGTGIVFLCGYLSEQAADYAVFEYPWQLMLGICVVIVLVCVIVPVAVYRTFSKNSVVDRMRSDVS